MHAVDPPLLSRLCPQGLARRQIREVEPDPRKKCPAFCVDVQGEAPVRPSPTTGGSRAERLLLFKGSHG